MRKSTYIVFLLFIYACSSHVNAQIVQEYHSDLNMNALRFWYSDPSKPTHIFNQNIAPKGDCLKVANGYLFLTWFKGGMTERNLMLSRMNLVTKQWVTIEFPDKSTLYSGYHNDKDMTGAGDSHRTAAVGICPIDGTVHLAYDMHVNPLNYRVSNKNIAFAPDSEFTIDNFSEKRDYLKSGASLPNFTYPSFLTNDAGEVIVEYRLGTSRQGDKYITYYNGDEWSDIILLVKGDNQNPQFNQYGDFSYQFGKMYLGCAIREYGSSITYNQGFYFAEAGQRGNDDWKNLQGQTFSVPIYGLTNFNNFKICDPLPQGNDGMTSSPKLVVSINGAVHMTNRVPNVGTVHYYTNVGSRELIKASSSSSDVSFGGNDQRVYSVNLSGGRLRVQSTPEGQSNWRTDFLYSGSERFALMTHYYYKNKIYVVAAEDIDSDKRPMHVIILKLTADTDNRYSSIPGKIEAENFNSMYGIQTMETSDLNEGEGIEFKQANSWLEYNVVVDKAGTYQVAYRVSSLSDSVKCNFTINGSQKGRLNKASTGGSQIWETGTMLVDLSAGQQKLRLEASGNWNLDWINVTPRKNSAPSVSFEIPKGDTLSYEDYNLYLRANASDSDGSITSVKLYIDDQFIRQDSSQPFEWGHNDASNPNELNGLHAGDHIFKVVATDNEGLTAEATFTLTVLDDFYKLKLTPCAAKASTSLSNHGPELATDGAINGQSYWAGSGKGASLVFDLCQEYNIKKLGLSWLYGDRWSYVFSIETSSDSVNWTPLLTDQNSSKLSEPELFSFTPTLGRYIRYIGNGNTVSSLNAITECDIYGDKASLDLHTTTHTESISISPNPASTDISIQRMDSEPFDIKIFDLNGTLIFAKQNITKSINIERSKFIKQGVYFIAISGTNSLCTTRKIIVL